jgi:hypothetical protein
MVSLLSAEIVEATFGCSGLFAMPPPWMPRHVGLQRNRGQYLPGASNEQGHVVRKAVAQVTQDGEIGELCYIGLMSPKVKEILQHVASWPEEDQEELADVGRDIEARRIGMYRLGDEERHAIQESLADVRAGRFASEAEIDAIFAKARAARR